MQTYIEIEKMSAPMYAHTRNNTLACLSVNAVAHFEAEEQFLNDDTKF